MINWLVLVEFVWEFLFFLGGVLVFETGSNVALNSKLLPQPPDCLGLQVQATTLDTILSLNTNLLNFCSNSKE